MWIWKTFWPKALLPVFRTLSQGVLSDDLVAETRVYWGDYGLWFWVPVLVTAEHCSDPMAAVVWSYARNSRAMLRYRRQVYKCRIFFQNNITCFSTLPCLKFPFARSIYSREKLMAGRSRALAQKVECIAAMFLLTNTNTAEHCVDILLTHLWPKSCQIWSCQWVVYCI